MPCNTAHHFAGSIRDAVSVPFLDMVSLSAAHGATLAGPGGAIGILASPAVRKVGLFDTRLAAVGLKALYATDEAATLAAIRQIKAEGPEPATRATLRAASEDLAARGAGVQMIACTEFSLIPDAVAPRITAFDTLDLLVRAIKEFAQANDTKEEQAAI